MNYLQKALEAERQGKSTVHVGFIGDTPYIHTEMLNLNGRVCSSATTFFQDWSEIYLENDLNSPQFPE